MSFWEEKNFSYNFSYDVPGDMPMKAGRELDALVAEKVMGWKVERHGNAIAFSNDSYGISQIDDPEYGFSPSIDIAAAWDVVEKLGQSYRVTIEWSKHYRHWWCQLDSTEPGEQEAVIADTAPLAICLAALKAVQGSSGSYDASSADGEISKPMADEST